MRLSFSSIIIFVAMALPATGAFAQDGLGDAASKMGGFFKKLANDVVSDLTTAPNANAPAKSTYEVPPQATGPVAYKGSIESFAQERRKNAIRFAGQYKNKVVVLSGKVLSVVELYKDASQGVGLDMNRPYVLIKFKANPESSLKDDENPEGHCHAEEAKSQEIARMVNRGDSIRVRGIYYNNVGREYFVDLAECVVETHGQ